MPDGVRPTLAQPAPTRFEDVTPTGTSPWQVGDVVLDTYEVRRVFAAGGMGLVYQVRHRGWGMDLAVKRPRPEFFRTDAQRADFEREAEAWAGLGLHPHVVTCHYVRRIDGVPCVFAEYAAGGSLADRLRDGPLAVADAIDTAIQAAWGLEHAHARGLIHQDVKPANLLVAGRPRAEATTEPRTTMPDGAVAASGTTEPLIVKVTDFGLAAARGTVESGTPSRTAGQTLTVPGAGIFTPEYAAPEQFAGESLTRRADVWAWAVTLLELLTGRRPAVGPAAPELLRAVDATAWPAGLHGLLRECLAVDPAARPRDMMAVATRLVECYRHLTGTGYSRRPSRAARLDLDAKNNRAVSLADLGKPAEAEVLWAEVLRAERDHPEAGYNLGLARWRAGRATFEEVDSDLKEVAAAFPDDPRPAILAAHVHLESGDPVAAETALGPGPDDGSANVRTVIRARAGQLPKLVWRSGGPHDATAAVWAGERHVVTAHRDRLLRVWDGAAGTLLHTLAGHRGIPDRLVASEDGRFVLSTGFAEEPGEPADLFVWDVAAGTCHWSIDPQGTKSGTLVPLAVDDDLAVTFDGAALQGWAAGRRVFEVPDAGHAAYTGGAIVTTAGDRDQLRLRVWGLPDDRPVNEFEIPSDVRDLSVTADGRFALGRVKGRLRTWELATGVESPGPPPGTTGFTVTQGGPAEYTSHLVTVRQAATDRPVAVFAPHGPRGDTVFALGPGRRLATAAEGVAVWQLGPKAEPYTAPPAVCVARRSEAVIAAEEVCDAALDVAREAMTRQDWVGAAEHVRTARHQPGADRRADAVALWAELATHLQRGAFRRGWWADSIAAPGVRDLAMTPDGRRIILSEHLRFRVWDVAAGRAVAETESPTARTVAIAPDGRTAYTAAGVAGRNLRLTATDLATGQPRWEATLPPLSVGFGDLRLSGDGRVLFSTHADHSVRRWDAIGGKLLATYTARLGGMSAVAPSDDGSWFATVDMNGTARVIDAVTGRSRRTLVRSQARSVAVAGRLVLVGTAPDESPPGADSRAIAPDDVLTIWDAVTGVRLRSLTGPLGGVECIALSADGAIAVAGFKHAAAAWDAETGELLREFPAHGDEVVVVSAADDRRAVVTAAGDAVRLWSLDWELTANPRPIRPAPEPIAWGDAFEGFRLAVQGDAPDAVPSESPPPPPEPLALHSAKLVLTGDGLYRGRPGQELSLLHPIREITAVELKRRRNEWAAVLIAGGIAAAVFGFRELPGWWAWAAAVLGGVAALLGVAAWRFPVLRVMTAAGIAEYEIHDPAADAVLFAASLRLAAGV